MPWDNVLVTAVVLGLFGLVLLIVLWPGERQGRRLLKKWGVEDPGERDVAETVRYLRRRRFWYPLLFFVLPLAIGRGGGSLWVIAWTLLPGGLLGELLALRPSRERRREASLVTRRVVDLVPAWALVLLAISTAGQTVHAVVTLDWLVLGVTIAAALAAGVIIALALRRPAVGDVKVDLVLRVRSARVATGLAIIAPATLPSRDMGMSAGLALVLVASLVAAIAIASPSPRVAETAR
ncbi:hypothetical protein FHX82_003542 [Amycolatopsis bartoniae]|uniref:Uncharacterized protein n=1 Tax=Amycolatopsis bartoniae TaxID=941986 RepID=A0A8H9IW49_9PSEU|nr:hypothetical protein [Amycolatopsis bartoniae]MBB2936478.1 hypothetical protein [Amycolatopsis bartoniae]TVT11039.1 hypothetical protein FNH07_03345 [Amycolatopsis bartoniae]GHF68655.1 hypothetical protein GCM10017566_48120 [Amycolatopsis bartoniae]